MTPTQSIPAGKANAFNWPFRQSGWPGSILLLCLCWVPLLGQMLLAGWAVEAIRLQGESASDPLPQPSRTATFLGNGLLLLMVKIVFYVIPLIILGWIIGFSWWLPIWNTIVWVCKVLLQKPHENMASFLLRSALTFLSDATAPIFYVLLISPLVLAGRVRYALTGRPTSFFRLFANTAFCVRHGGEVLLYFLLSYLFSFGVDLLVPYGLALPPLGWLAVIALVAAGCWMRSFWAGGLARSMHAEFKGKLQPAH